MGNPFEKMPQPGDNKGDKEKDFYAGAEKNPDGTLDYSQAATVPDADGKLAKQSEKNSIKENTEREMGFDWERSLQRRFNELSLKSLNQGLSGHGRYELEKLMKVIELLRGM